MKKLVFFAVLLLILGSTEIFAQKGSFKKAQKLQNAAWNRLQQYGENDTEVLNLYTQAIDEYKRCVQIKDKNTGNAYHNFGRLYNSAPKSLRDYEEAKKNFTEAIAIYKSEKKINTTLLSLAYLDLGNACYLTESFELAHSNYTNAVEISNNYAGSLAMMYWYGLGVEQDLPMAMELYKKSAMTGNDEWVRIYAIDYQIKEYQQGNYDNPAIVAYMDYLYLMSINEPKSVWFPILIQAADLGYAPAQFDTWIIYRNDKDFDKGLPYLQKSADNNFLPAFAQMGYAYHYGVGLPINYQEAQKYYEKGSIGGVPVAQNDLGVLYYEKRITPPSGYSYNDMAYYWFNVSAEQGFRQAISNRQSLIAQSPQYKLAAISQILSSVAEITNTAFNIYNTLNKSKMQAYTPPSNRTTQYTNSSTPNSSKDNSDYGITSCKHQQERYNSDAEWVKKWMEHYKNQWVTYYRDKAAGKTGSLYSINVTDELKQIRHFQSSMKQHRKICPSIPQSELETITPKAYIKKHFGLDVDY